MSETSERAADPDFAELDAAEELRLSALLRAAFTPSEIDPARHERLLLAALEDPFAAASPEELVESDRLRRALEGEGDHEHLRLARALSAAFTPRAAQPLPAPELPAVRGPAGTVIFGRFAGVASALAFAAAIWLWLAPVRHERSPSAPDLTTLAQSRSTAAFFHASSAGAPSDRIDRIASARGRDLRDNRYALWGVK